MKVTVRGITIEGTAEELRPWLPPVPSAEATGIPWEDDLGSPACAPWEPGGSHGRCFCGADRRVSVDYPATAAAAK